MFPTPAVVKAKAELCVRCELKPCKDVLRGIIATTWPEAPSMAMSPLGAMALKCREMENLIDLMLPLISDSSLEFVKDQHAAFLAAIYGGAQSHPLVSAL